MTNREAAARIAELERQVAELRDTVTALPARFGTASLRGTYDDPTVVGSAAEGAEDADAAGWDRILSLASGDDGLTLTMMTRVVYDEAGDEILYGMMRTFSFDSQGKLYAVSAETRVVIDTPSAC